MWDLREKAWEVNQLPRQSPLDKDRLPPPNLSFLTVTTHSLGQIDLSHGEAQAA